MHSCTLYYTLIFLLNIPTCLAAPPAGLHAHHWSSHRHTRRDDVRQLPYITDKWTRMYQNQNTSSHLMFSVDPLAALDETARAVVRSTVAMQAQLLPVDDTTVEHGENLRLPKRSSTNPIMIPRVQSAKIIGACTNDPATQYINLPSAALPILPTQDLKPGIHFAVTEDYHTFWNGSGTLQLNPQTQPYLTNMAYQPLISRDGGQGGKIGSHKLFIFEDTQSFSPSGTWVGFSSNTVAEDSGNRAISGQAPILQDKLGEFANGAGTMRNFIPFTTGEAAYNSVRVSQGQRFGIWPGSSLIPYGQTSALLYAPIIYTNTAPGAQLISYVGMTLVKVTVPSEGGAFAERIAPMLLEGPGIEWGAIGGIRKLKFENWADGNENHGLVYVIGNAAGGMFLARVGAKSVANWAAYEFYHASTRIWTSTAPKASATADLFIAGAYSTADMFYSPKHRTFLLTYMTPYADNTFYWRYLQAPHAIAPTDPGDYVENIVRYPWSAGQVLLSIPPGASYAYAGGMYRGYSDGEDITEGGDTMLLGWTQPTGKKQPYDLTHNVATITWA